VDAGRPEILEGDWRSRDGHRAVALQATVGTGPLLCARRNGAGSMLILGRSGVGCARGLPLFFPLTQVGGLSSISGYKDDGMQPERRARRMDNQRRDAGAVRVLIAALGRAQAMVFTGAMGAGVGLAAVGQVSRPWSQCGRGS
jgi:hypothetical protein